MMDSQLDGSFPVGDQEESDAETTCCSISTRAARRRILDQGIGKEEADAETVIFSVSTRISRRRVSDRKIDLPLLLICESSGKSLEKVNQTVSRLKDYETLERQRKEEEAKSILEQESKKQLRRKETPLLVMFGDATCAQAHQQNIDKATRKQAAIMHQRINEEEMSSTNKKSYVSRFTQTPRLNTRNLHFESLRTSLQSANLDEWFKERTLR